MTRVTEDINMIEQFLTDSLLTIVASTLLVVGMFAVMLSMDLVLGATALVLAPLFLLLIHRFTSRIKPLSRSQRRDDGALASVAQETISAIHVVKAFTAEERENARFRRFGQRSLQAKMRVAHLEAQFGWAADVVAAAGTAAVVVIGTQRALAGAITPGDLLIFVTYLRRLYSPLKDLLREINKTPESARPRRARGRGARYRPDRERPARGARGASAARPHRLRSGRVRLSPRRARARGRQLAHRSGPNSGAGRRDRAGKSTLAALVPRFYDVTSGSVALDGTDVRRYTLRSLRSQIALVLQESVLFHASIADNIAYGNPTASPAQVRAAALAANADEFITALPSGYETVLGERGATLSGGQRQRIAVARALVRNAPIVILDEPTTGLDAHTEALLLEALRRLSTGRTTLVIAHSLSTIAGADLVVVLDGGRIVESGSHATLLARRGRYVELFGRQAGAAGR